MLEYFFETFRIKPLMAIALGLLGILVATSGLVEGQTDASCLSTVGIICILIATSAFETFRKSS